MLLLVLLVLLPVVTGVLLPFLKLEDRKKKLTLLTAVMAVEAVGVTAACLMSAPGGVLFRMTESLVLTFRVDNISRLFALIAAWGWLIIGIFSYEYMKHEERENQFYACFMIVEGALLGMDFAGNLITMYFFFEMITVTSVPLVLHSRSKESIAAALKYLYYSITGAFLGLMGIFIFSAFTTGSMEFAPGGMLDMTRVAGHETLIQWVAFLSVVGFGAKAGMYPLHGWLPAAHPVAPAPASAALSGIIAKAGVLGILRIIFYVVGVDFLRGTWVQTAWLCLSLLTVFMGSMMAFHEKLFKKRLAYSTVSQISYVLTGLFLMTPGGVTGGLLHVLFHATIKSALFLTAGAIICRLGKTRVEEMEGIGKELPRVMWGYTFAALSLVGIPPFNGFVSKWYLASGALNSGLNVFFWLVPAVLLISALLTAGYLLSITVHAFFPGKEFQYPAEVKEVPTLWVPVLLLGILCLVMGVFSNVLVGWMSGIAALIA